MRLTLDEVLRATGGRLLGGNPADALITGVSTDTRTLRPGDLFVALPGPRADGHDYIAEAFRKGAAAVLASRPVSGGEPGPLVQVPDGLRALADLARAYRRSLALTVIGITGSVGKTTTAAMCAAALGSRLAVARTREEWNAEIGVPLAILELEPHHRAAVIEMAMRGLGQIAELASVAAPQVGVITNIGPTHLELLGTIENIARAKGELVEALPEDGWAVLNRDDPRVHGLSARTPAQVLTYGLHPDADVRAEAIEPDERGMRVTIASAGRRLPVMVPAPGRHNVSNALAAAAVARVCGLDLAAVAEGLATYAPPKMRLQLVRAGGILVVNDAYNASPSSMDAAFEVLTDLGRGRRTVAVLGEMKELGPEAPRLHREVGRSLARHRVAVLVAVEREARAIADGAIAGGMPQDAVIYLPSVEAAARRLPGLVRSGDVVLVKGSRALAMERIVDALLEGHR